MTEEEKAAAAAAEAKKKADADAAAAAAAARGDGRTERALADDVAKLGARVEIIEKNTASFLDLSDDTDADTSADGDEGFVGFLETVGLLSKDKPNKAPSADAGG